MKKLKSENYKTEYINLSPRWLRSIGLLTTMLVSILMTKLFIFKNGKINFWINDNFLTEILIVLGIVFIMFFHAFIHCIIWSRFCLNDFSEMDLKFAANNLIFTCKCRKPLKKTHSIIGKAMPLIMMGITLGILSIIIKKGNSF